MPETALSRLFASLAQREIFKNPDLLLSNEDPLEPVDIFVNLDESAFKASSASLENMVYDGQRGVALVVQVVSASAPCIVRANRPDGPTFDPTQELIWQRKIRRLFVHSAQGSGQLHLRLYIDPSILLVSSPELAVTTVKVKNVGGSTINPATDESVSGVNSTLTSNIAAKLQTLIDQGKNSNTGFSKKYSVGTTVVQGDNRPVPDGFAVAIWADSGNSGEIAFTLDGTDPGVGTNASLKAGQGITVRVTNINKLKFIASAAAQIVNVCVEL